MGVKSQSGRGINLLAGVLVSCAAFAALGVAQTRAAIVLSSSGPTGSSGAYSYAYTAYLFNANSTIGNGNVIVIPNFAGYVSGSGTYTAAGSSTAVPLSTTSSPFKLTTPATFTTLIGANGAIVADTTIIPGTTNLELTYSSTSPVSTASGSPLPYVDLGTFTFNSTVGSPVPGAAIFSDTFNGKTEVGTNAITVPASTGTVAPVPLPAAFWPGLFTLAGLALGARFRRRAAPVKI